MANQWITKLPYRRDGLYEKFASINEGWQILNGEQVIDVPLGKLDEVAYRILGDSIEQNKKVAIALPRVKTGISLSIIAYLVVNRFIKQHGRTLQDFLPVALDSSQSIIIATQNRRLRDFFLLSSLRFAGTSFPFTYFPIYRIKHSGELTPLVNKTEAKGQININPIVFYHYDSLETLPQSLINGCLLGELVETNSADLANKLCDFIDNLSIKSSLIVVNQYSEGVLSVLRNRGFHILNFGLEDILNGLTTKSQSDLPSLNSSLINIPNKVTIKLQLVEDKNIESKLTKILQALLLLNSKFIDSKPKLLFKAWGIFYLLKDLSVPLKSLELYRKRNPWLKTIKHNINQTFQFPLDKLDDFTRSTLAPVWGTLESEFNELYSALEVKNPKYEFVKTQISKNDGAIIFQSQGQEEVLKEEMLLNELGTEERENDQIFFINDLIKSSQRFNEIILPGIWRKNDESRIFSLLPKIINVICYSSELPAIPVLLNRLNKSNMGSWSRETFNSIKELEPETILVNDNESPTDWITPDADSQFFIDYFKEFVPEGIQDIPDFNKIEWLSNQPEEEDDEVETEESDKDNDESVPAYKILLENGRMIYIPTDQEVMAYSEDEEIQSKLAEALQPGDIILLYSQEQNREMFESVLQRTQELSGVDPRILSLWKTAAKLLREKYDVTNPNSLRAYIHDLRDNNCEKTEQAVKMWLKGTTLAPRDQEDIECLLNLIEYKNANPISKLIHREIGNVRVFHRVLGRRLKAKLGNLIRGQDTSTISRSVEEPIDREIDEILEMADAIAIKDISKDIKYVQKSDVKINVLG